MEATLFQTISAINAPEQQPRELLTLLKKYGVVLINNYLDTQTLEQLNTEFDLFLSEDSNDYQERTPYADGRAARVKRANIPEDRYPATSRFFSQAWMQQLAEQYLDGPVALNKEIFVVNDVVGKKHLANDLHFDVASTFKYFVYLTDTSAENGAFTCAPGSHLHTCELRKKLGSKISYENREITRDLPVENFELIPVEAPAGSLIIFDTDVFHKAGVVNRGERRVMRGHTRLVKKKKGWITRKLSQLFSN